MILQGHVLDKLAEMEAESVSCSVTSPPYWSLRKYDAGDVVWGGEADCEHEWAQDASALARTDGGYSSQKRWQHAEVNRVETPEAWGGIFETGNTCSLCGAWRGQFGLEPTPEMYVEHTLDVLRAIRRVLRPDGVVWWNIGDGYASRLEGAQQGSQRWKDAGGDWAGHEETRDHSVAFDAKAIRASGLKPKDLVLMPSRVALAAQADGWWVRSMIVWSKPNAMPESCKDRPTTAHEYVLMLTKSARYWYDQEAVREPLIKGAAGSTFTDGKTGAMGLGRVSQLPREDNPAGRNMRSVWEFPTAQTPEAHFATFPEELPRRCIEASCPREICAKCGTARVRVVETGDRKADEGPHAWTYSKDDGDPTSGAASRRASGVLPNHHYETQTTGWTSCACAEPDYQPGIVLDPFAGIGTTGVVAKRLGRRFAGIELSEKYAEMARAKLAMWWRRTEMVATEAQEAQAVLPFAAATGEED